MDVAIQGVVASLWIKMMTNQENDIAAHLGKALADERRRLGAEYDKLREELDRVRDAAKNEIERLRAELSSIKASQDEPVGTVLGSSEMIAGYDKRFGNVVWFNKPVDPALLYLHPSPTPEGGKLVPIEANQNWIDSFVDISGYEAREAENLINLVLSAAPAAPKGEKE
jgi:hypothetical protein